MNIVRTGIILNTEKYDECVLFYKTLFDLKILFQEQYGDFRLTSFEFSDSYLMVETEGHAKAGGKTVNINQDGVVAVFDKGCVTGTAASEDSKFEHIAKQK